MLIRLQSKSAGTEKAWGRCRFRQQRSIVDYLNSRINHEFDSQVTQEHHNRHLSNARDIDGRLGERQRTGQRERPRCFAHLIPYVLFEILFACDVQANAALTKRFGLDLVCRTWDGGNHDIGDRQAVFKGELGRVCDVVSVEPVSNGCTRARSFGVFLWRVSSRRWGNEREIRTWMESISTENTRAPSFANNAARGRPTTSDLKVGGLNGVNHF